MATGGSEGGDEGTPRPSLGILKALRDLPQPAARSTLGPLPVLRRSAVPTADRGSQPDPTPDESERAPTGEPQGEVRGAPRSTPGNTTAPSTQARGEPSSLLSALSINARGQDDPSPSEPTAGPSAPEVDLTATPSIGSTPRVDRIGDAERATSGSPADGLEAASPGFISNGPRPAPGATDPPPDVDDAPKTSPPRIKRTQEKGLGSGIPQMIDRSLDATPPIAIRALDPMLVPPPSPVQPGTDSEARPTADLDPSNNPTPDDPGAKANITPGERSDVPSQIGRFTVLKLLGSGGMGEVYATYDPDLDRRVALKVLHAQVSQSSSSSTARARLLREAKALAKLSHPNVVAIYDVGTVDEQIFIAMEYVKGMTLTKWMRQSSEPLADDPEAFSKPWPDVLALFLQAGRGLAAAHKAGIIHRDFKPDNVLMGRDGRVRVVDFGLARADSGHPERPDTFADAIKSLSSQSSSVFELRLTRTGGMAGTPAYMAPEQYLNLQVDARTDQFSYCVALYEGLYGERPFRGDTVARVRKAVINGEIVDAPKDSDVPEWLRNILLRGLSVHPGARYPSMDALLAELSDNPGRPQQSWLKAAMVLTAALLIGAFAFVQFREVDEGRLLDSASCSADGAAAPLLAAYGPERERALEERFAASGLADANQTWRRVDDLLDEMAVDVAKSLRSVCTLDHLRGEGRNPYVDRQHECLARRLGPLGALAEALAEIAPEEHGHAVPAAHALLGLTPCSDPSSLQVRVDAPDDPELIELSARLRTDLDRARATAWLGRVDEALTIARQVSTEAGHSENFAVRAEAFLLKGEFEELRGDFEGAVRSLREALWHAEASRHDEVAIDSLTILVRVLQVDLQRHDDADNLPPRLTAAVRRLGDRRRDARAQHSLGLAESARGNTDAAIVRFQDAATTAQTIEGSYGRLLSASIRADLGRALADAGRLDEALEHHQQAVDALESTMGTNHPAVARGTLALCESWAAKGELGRALRTCRRALELRGEPSVPGYQRAEARFALARVTLLAKRNDEAIAGARKALDEIAGDPAGKTLSKRVVEWLREHA